MLYGEARRLVMIATGGTGGHVFSGLSVARCLRERDVGVVWLGSSKGMESDQANAAGIEFEGIGVEGLRRRGLLPWLLAPWRLSGALLQSLRVFLRRKPAVLIGFGGFASGPGGLIAVALGVPLLVHEQNAVAGLTNRLLAPFSKRVLLGFPGSIDRAGARCVGNPVRADITTVPKPAVRLRGRRGALRLLVVGGSRGAAVFNDVVPRALAEIDSRHRPEVVQQTGVGKRQSACDNAARAGVEIDLFEFIDDIAAMYVWADLVLCRAGASSVAEIAVAGIAAVLVPYPYAVDDHQTANAQFLVSRGAAELIMQPQFTPRHFARVLRRFSVSRGELLRLAENANRLARPDASREIADLCIQTMDK